MQSQPFDHGPWNPMGLSGPSHGVAFETRTSGRKKGKMHSNAPPSLHPAREDYLACSKQASRASAVSALHAPPGEILASSSYDPNIMLAGVGNMVPAHFDYNPDPLAPFALDTAGLAGGTQEKANTPADQSDESTKTGSVRPKKKRRADSGVDFEARRHTHGLAAAQKE